MTFPLATRADVRSALGSCPPDPLQVPAGLAGWRRVGMALCIRCAVRISARFFGCGAFRSWSPIEAPADVECCGCGMHVPAGRATP